MRPFCFFGQSEIPNKVELSFAKCIIILMGEVAVYWKNPKPHDLKSMLFDEGQLGRIK